MSEEKPYFKMKNKTQTVGKTTTESIGVTEMQKPKTCQKKYLLCGHIYGDNNAEIKTEINQWCDACARELEHGHTPEAIKQQRRDKNKEIENE